MMACLGRRGRLLGLGLEVVRRGRREDARDALRLGRGPDDLHVLVLVVVEVHFHGLEPLLDEADGEHEDGRRADERADGVGLGAVDLALPPDGRDADGRGRERADAVREDVRERLDVK